MGMMPPHQPDLSTAMWWRGRRKSPQTGTADSGLTGDPTGLCLPHGLPRMMVAIFPVEFVVTPKVTYYMTDYTTSRRIFLTL